MIVNCVDGSSATQKNLPVRRQIAERAQKYQRADTFVRLIKVSGNFVSNFNRYTLNLTGEGNFVAIDGPKPADMKPDMVTVGTGTYFPNIAFGNSFTLNGLTFTGAPYNSQSPQMVKDLLYVDSDGNVFTGDRSKPMDSQGYPSVLSASPWGKKG